MPQFRPPPPCMGQNKPKTKIVIRAGGGYGPVGLGEGEESNLPNKVADFVGKQFVDLPKK